jgi:phosphoribosylformimino-5-aminoimidazole carboxamide ribonucleotide (ProFAR) isomerase
VEGELRGVDAGDDEDVHDVLGPGAATSGRLVVAGSITGTDQIHSLAAAGVDAFTIGSAAFDGSLQPHAGTLRAQLAPVVGL